MMAGKSGGDGGSARPLSTVAWRPDAMPTYRDSRKRDNRWIADFRYRKRRHWKSFRTKKEAEAWEKAEKKRLRLPAPLERPEPTGLDYASVVAEVLEWWRNRDQDAEWLRTKGYILLGGPFGAWQDTPISLITREIIETRLGEIKESVSAEAANRYLRILRAMFNVAVSRGRVNGNPVRGIEEFPRLVRPEMGYVPSQADIRKLLLKATPRDRSYIEIMFYSLARPFEIQRLRWADIDLATNLITLWTRKRDKSRSWTPRAIPIHPKLRKGILRIKEDAEPGQEYVFIHKRTGRPYQRRPKALQTLCVEAGVQRIQWRGFRKAAATALLDEGVPVPTISELLGHTSLETTKRYLGIDRQRLREAVEVLV